MKRRIYINLLTKSLLISEEEGRKLLDIWISNLPNYLPEVYGNYEPLRDKFDKAKVSHCLEKWSYPFLVKRGRPKMNGSIFMGGGKIPTHGWIHIVLEFSEIGQSEAVSFAKAISRSFTVEFGFLHLLTRREFSEESTSGVHSVNINRSMDVLRTTTHDLRVALPDIYWGTFFGPSYVQLFGKKTFHVFPACVDVEELSQNSYYLQLSEKIVDIEQDFNLFTECREKVKDHLGRRAFLDAVSGLNIRYLVPNFSYF